MQGQLALKTLIWIYDIDHSRIVWANQAALKWWYSPAIEELQSRDFKSASSSAVQESLLEYKSRFARGESFSSMWYFYPKGIEKQAFCQFSGVHIDDGRIAMLIEATPSELLALNSDKYSTALLATYSTAGVFQSANPPFVTEFGSAIPNFHDLIVRPDIATGIITHLSSNASFESDVQLKSLHGLTWFRLVASGSIDTNLQRTILLHLTNVDERKKRELSLIRQAHTDTLTGLFNRRGLFDKLNYNLEMKLPICVFYIDLDGFKMINDSLGHSTGDDILREVSTRLSGIKHSLACRYGGDEFVLVINHSIPTKEAESLAQRLVSCLSKPYTDQQSNMLTLSASVGFARFPQDSSKLENVIRFADAAMYHSKKLGKKRWTQYVINMDTEILRKSLVAQYLSIAIDNNELFLYYQPILNVSTRTIDSFEALLRWHCDALGAVSTEEIISVAEDIGLISDLENWVMQTAIDDLPTLRKATNSQANIAINVSGIHICDPNLPNYLLHHLHKHALTPSDLNIEITESVVLEGLEREHNPLTHMIELGIKISIDDFGTGYSSLAYLHTIKASTVKIDKAFLNVSGDYMPTLKAIHQLIESLNIQSLIEGIETPEQANVATAIGIKLQQGYFYSEPQPLSYFLGGNFKFDHL